MDTNTEEKYKMFVFGLEEAGKTALISTFQENKTVKDTEPTLNLLVSKYFTDNVKFMVWDAPGQVNCRNTWEKGFSYADLLVFVLDVSEKQKFEEAKEEFKRVLEETKKGVYDTPKIVFCFHKMDLDEAKENLEEAKEFFNLKQYKSRKIVWFETSIYHLDKLKELKKILEEIAMGIYF